MNIYMVSLKNTVKIHNVIQSKQFRYLHYILLQMPVKGAKGLVIHLQNDQVTTLAKINHGFSKTAQFSFA